jgi:DNA-binding NarL/FixJ family response regulator
VLVARGESNRRIASRLLISERTVRTHVSNVLGKLGLASRTQAALWAVREGLVPGA